MINGPGSVFSYVNPPNHDTGVQSSHSMGSLASIIHKKPKKLYVAFPWVETSTEPGGFMICVFIILRELPKAQPKVVLWRSRELNLRPLV